MGNPYSAAAHAYKEKILLSASRLKVVQVLYDEAILSLKQAKMRLESGAKEADFRQAVLKAQNIVSELFASLNYKDGQDIAENLAALYQFCLSQLIDAGINRTPASIDAVLRVLSTLEEGWDQIPDDGEPVP